ncbi:MAG: beta-ketoacyl-ACP synthase II [Bacteroidetes bacterium]|jgi:3-oxoacyl-[acyl-carrier-protein] synthase II|nr:beta-ketoacyl-ACP synthase II [Bacteroidota bacterium]
MTTTDASRILVTGLGALTPIGLSPDAFWDGLMRGQSGAAPITRFDASAFKTRFACELEGFDPQDFMDRKQVSRFDPYCQYALAAARQALDDAGLDPAALTQSEKDRVGVIIGTGMGGVGLFEEQARTLAERGPDRISPFLVPMMIPNMAAGIVAMEFGLRGPNHCVVSACASGNHAIGDAMAALRSGQADVAICGGTEAPITPLTVGGFAAMRALSTRNDDPEHASRPFDADRDGFVAGEGAGMLILETYEHAMDRGAEVYAEVAGFGASADAYHYAAPDPDGEGVVLAMQRALEDAALPPDAVDYVNAHATSTPAGDPIETKAIRAALGEHADQVKVSSTKSMTGHLLGAAGAIEAIASILAINRGAVPPTINLDTLDEACTLDVTPNAPVEMPVAIAANNAFGFGGHNTTTVFRRFTD